MRVKANNIILIGMPACGKSTIGILLAKRMLRGFIDTDVCIQSAQAVGLQEIIDTEGLKRFREIEEMHVLQLKADNAVIATGGSVVYSDKAIRKLSEGSVVVYLELPLNEIQKRLTNLSSRGVVMGRHQSLESLYNERLPIYEKYADVTVNCSGLNHEQTIEAIMIKVDKLVPPRWNLTASSQD